MTLTVTPVESIPPLKPQELGLNQLLWLRDKVAAFPAAHDSVEKAQIHTAKVRSDLLRERGAAA